MNDLLAFVRVPALRPPEAVAAVAWVDDPSQALLRHFRHVRDSRMAGLPFLNDAVDVCVADCVRIDGDWLAAVVTPWSIQLVLVPGGGSLWQDTSSGVRRSVTLPVGEMVFIGEVDEGEAIQEGGVPAFLYCPLISPLDGIAGTNAACAIARDALAVTLSPPAMDEEPLAPVVSASPPSLSRRAFLRGGSR